jgi:hypothetical protein
VLRCYTTVHWCTFGTISGRIEGDHLVRHLEAVFSGFEMRVVREAARLLINSVLCLHQKCALLDDIAEPSAGDTQQLHGIFGAVCRKLGSILAASTPAPPTAQYSPDSTQ